MFENDETLRAEADMQAMGYRADVSDRLDEVVTGLRNKGREVFYVDDEGRSFVSAEMLYIIAESFSLDGMKSIMTADLNGSAAYAHAATLVNITARKSEGKEANVPNKV